MCKNRHFIEFPVYISISILPDYSTKANSSCFLSRLVRITLMRNGSPKQNLLWKRLPVMQNAFSSKS